MSKLIKYFARKLKALLLVDSIGAFTTAFILFVIMRHFNEYVGMPEKELTWLVVIAVVFCIYSATCFLFLNGNLGYFIRFIGIANLIYCAQTAGLMIKYNAVLTTIGKAYFVNEIIIICVLSYVELKVAGRKENMG
jgi:hypothetical protein